MCHKALKECNTDMPLNSSIHKVMIIGSGPIVIGQAAEFDYAGNQAWIERGISGSVMNASYAESNRIRLWWAFA